MTNLKKKLLAGVLSGAIIFTGGLTFNSVQAADNFENHQQKLERHHHERPQMTDEQRSKFIKEFADYYGVNQAEVEAAFKNRVHFEDLKNAAVLAKLSGKSFSEVLEMKSDWRQVAEKLGVSREQFEAFMKNEMLDGLAKHSKLDKKTVESLLKDNYNPHDITIAGLIANESGKSVKNVIAKKKINNNWEDVAKEFNIDLKKFINFEHGPHFDRRPAPNHEDFVD
jgi:hypothetical protein